MLLKRKVFLAAVLFCLIFLTSGLPLSASGDAGDSIKWTKVKSLKMSVEAMGHDPHLGLLMAASNGNGCFAQASPSEEKNCTLTPSQIKFFSSGKRNVVDYYRTLVSCQLVAEYYELHYIDDRWTNGEAGDLYSFVVDINNGFIQFDEESGDAYETSQIALFRNKNGDAIIGYYDELRVGAYFGYQYADLSFYRFDKTQGRLLNVTQKVLPQITLSDFGISDTEYQKLKGIKQELFSSAIENTILFSYKLPRYGTNVTVNLVVNKSQLEHYRQYITEPSDLEILNHYYSRIAKETIELKWDWQLSRLVIH